MSDEQIIDKLVAVHRGHRCCAHVAALRARLAEAEAQRDALAAAVAAWDADLSPYCDGPLRDAVRATIARARAGVQGDAVKCQCYGPLASYGINGECLSCGRVLLPLGENARRQPEGGGAGER